MQLQKQLSRKVGDKEYAKWVITIPPEKIEELGWKEGQQIKLKTKSKRKSIELTIDSS